MVVRGKHAKYAKEVEGPPTPIYRSSLQWQGSDWAKTCHFGTRIILSWSQPRSTRLGKSLFLPPLKFLKELQRGSLPRSKLLPEITLIRRYLAAWQEKHLCTKHLLFSPSCELPSSTRSPRALDSQKPRCVAAPGSWIFPHCHPSPIHTRN